MNELHGLSTQSDLWDALKAGRTKVRELEAEVASLVGKLAIQANRCIEEANRAEKAETKFHEAIGCTYAACCSIVSNGGNLLTTEFPSIAETVLKALQEPER